MTLLKLHMEKCLEYNPVGRHLGSGASYLFLKGKIELKLFTRLLPTISVYQTKMDSLRSIWTIKTTKAKFSMNFKSISFSQRTSTLKTILWKKHLRGNRHSNWQIHSESQITGSAESFNRGLYKRMLYIHQKVVAPADTWNYVFF